MATANDIEIVSAVMSKVLNKDGYAYDNIFGRIPIIKYMLIKDANDVKSLRVNGRVRKLDGGQDIEIPLEYAVENSMQTFSGLDPITFTQKEILTNAKYDWKHCVQTILMDKKDILKASGSAKKIASLVDTHLRNGAKSMATSLNTMILAASPGSNDFHSLPQLVPDDPTASATIGGIAQATHSWWNNKYQNSAATTYQLLINEIVNQKNDIMGNMAGDAPDVAITDQIVYEYLISYATSKGTHTFMNTEMSNALNVDVMKVRGMDLLWDTGVIESTVGSKSRFYMLNSDYLQICVHQDRQFDVTEKMDMLLGQKQDAVGWAIFLMGNLTCSNRAKQGVIFDIAQNLTA